MSVHEYPGLFGDSRSGRLWPALLGSALLHVGLFWGFSRVRVAPAERLFEAPVQMVELGEPGGGPGGAREERPGPPEEPSDEISGAEEPSPEPAAEPETRGTPVKPSAPAQAPGPTAPREPPPTGARVELPTRPRSAATSDRQAAAAPRSTDGPAPRPGQPATGGAESDDQVARRVAELRARQQQSAAEEQIRQRIAKLEQQREAGASEEQLRRRLQQLQRGVGGAGPGVGRGDGGGAGPGGVTAEQAYGMDLKQYVRDRRLWAVPEVLRGKPIWADVTIAVDRRGRIQSYEFERSSENAFFNQQVEATLHALKAAQDLPPPRAELPGAFVLSIRFRADERF